MRRALPVLLVLLVPAALAGQEVRTAVVPRDITVGDVFQVVIQVAPVASGTVTFPDSLELPADIEVAGRRTVRVDTTAGGVRWSAVYPVAGWRPGTLSLPAASVTLSMAGRVLTAPASFPAVAIRSVLPADTAGIQPQPPRDVVGADRIWWPWLLLAAVILLILLVASYFWKRRRRPASEPALTPGLSPRAAALLALEQARASGTLEAGEYKLFFSDVSAAVRGYLAALDPGLGMDLTTTELLGAFRGIGREREAAGLNQVLSAADLVKFARHRPGRNEATALWDVAKGWVESFEETGSMARAA